MMVSEDRRTPSLLVTCSLEKVKCRVGSTNGLRQNSLQIHLHLLVYVSLIAVQSMHVERQRQHHVPALVKTNYPDVLKSSTMPMLLILPTMPVLYAIALILAVFV